MFTIKIRPIFGGEEIRHFDTHAHAERWLRQIGRAEIIPEIVDNGSDPGAYNDPQADPILGLLDAARAALDFFGPGDTTSPLQARLRSAIAAASEYVGGAPGPGAPR